MCASNPTFVLRNYVAQNAIEAAEKGDFSEVRRVLELLEAPYQTEVEAMAAPTCSRPPPWAAELSVT